MSNKGKIAIAFAVVLAILVKVPVFAKLKASFGLNLQQEYDRIGAQGQPLTFDELDAWYERPADNAAVLYAKAFSAHVEPAPELQSRLPWEQNGAALPPNGQPLPEMMRLAIEQYVRQNAGTIALLHEAATHSLCRYPIDLRKGPAVELNHLAKIRGLTRLLADQALLLADTGQPDGAADSLVAAFTLANSLQGEPLLISQLVRLACAQIAIDALTWTSDRTSFDAAQSARLSDALSPFSNEGAFWRGYVGERCMQMVWDPRTGPGPRAFVPNVNPDAVQYTQSVVFEKDLAYLLHVLSLAIQGAKLPPDEGQGELQEAGRLAREAPPDYLISNGKGPFENTGSSAAEIVDKIRARERAVAARRTAITALATKHH